jgi:hypothetical protein
MSHECETCNTLDRQLRDLEIEIEAETDKRRAGFTSGKEERASQQRLGEILALFHGAKALQDHHRAKSHV